MKVSLFQCIPVSVSDMCSLVFAALREQERECVKSDFFVFPEHSLLYVYRRGSLAGLETLLEASLQVGLCFTCEERGGKDVFVTTLLLRKGCLVGEYRKRRATVVGAHAEGNEALFFDVSPGLTGSVLICFDVENQSVREEVFMHGPIVVFNPTQIPGGNIVSPAAWKTAVDTMRNKFEKMCGDMRVFLLRCDLGAPMAAGSSQFIGPCSSVSVAASCAGQRLDVFVDVSDNFGEFVLPPKRERTKLEENAGARCTSQFVVSAGCRAAESFGGNVLLLLSDDGSLCAHNARDGSKSKTRAARDCADLAALSKIHAAVVLERSSVDLFDVNVFEVAATRVFEEEASRVWRFSDNEAAVLLSSRDLKIWDVRSNVVISEGTKNVHCCWGNEAMLLLGTADSLIETDRRKEGVVWSRQISCPVKTISKESFLLEDGSLFGAWRDALPRRADVVSMCLDAAFAGVRDGSIVCGPRDYKLRVHSNVVEKLTVTNDRRGLLSVSSAGALVLTWFEFNCERCHTIDEMFKF
jgi:hypothetical protein